MKHLIITSGSLMLNTPQNNMYKDANISYTIIYISIQMVIKRHSWNKMYSQQIVLKIVYSAWRTSLFITKQQLNSKKNQIRVKCTQAVDSDMKATLNTRHRSEVSNIETFCIKCWLSISLLKHRCTRGRTQFKYIMYICEYFCVCM